MKPNREKIEAEELVKERLPLTKWELTPKEKEDFDRVMRLIFDAASILRYDLELGEDAIGKTLVELADWATNWLSNSNELLACAEAVVANAGSNATEIFG